MMIKPLIKKEFKSNFKILCVFLIIISLYSSIIVAMYDPELGKSIDMMAESMPELFAAFGMMNPGLTLLDFIVNYLYGFILIFFPILFVIILCYRLMAQYIDKGSLSYLLTCGHTRKQVLITQYLTLIVNIMLLILYITVFISICSFIMFHEKINIINFIILNCGLLMLHFFFSSLCFLSACLFNEIKYSIGIGGGISIIFILIQMLSQVSERIDFLKYLTPLSLFNAKGLITSQYSSYIQVFILFFIGVVIHMLTCIFFQKRNLPL